MIYYDLPSAFKPGLEEPIVKAVKDQLGKTFPPKFDPKKVNTLPLSPQQSLAAIQTKPNLVVELVAAEPLVDSPVFIDFGPDGKLWVCEMIDYPEGKDSAYTPGGRISFLEDLDGDGRMDRGTSFLDGLPFPTGVKVWRKGVLICAPDILFAEDTNGDGKADVVKEALQRLRHRQLSGSRERGSNTASTAGFTARAASTAARSRASTARNTTSATATFASSRTRARWRRSARASKAACATIGATGSAATTAR